MISICIPVYNYDVTKLVEEIHQQFSKAVAEFEIILADDGSSTAFHEQYRLLQKLPKIQVVISEINLGRSRIRNLLVQKARFSYLLFCDCDSGIASKSFAENYLRKISEEYDCVYGGRIYPLEIPKGRELHWKYGTHREALNAAERLENPYRFFMTNNFLVKKKVFERLSFNEELQGYGYEDSLFALGLKKNQYLVHHIDNPLIHLQLESTPIFLQKTKEALLNLKHLTSEIHDGKENIKLLKVYRWFKKWRLVGIIKFLFRKNHAFLIKHLSEKSPNLYLLDFYKLGYFSSLCN